MFKEVIVISDLWGHRQPIALAPYQAALGPDVQLRYYDATLLADIAPSVKRQEELHKAFVNGGIDRAVQQLLKLEPNATHLLGCSVGGIIAWRYLSQQAPERRLLAERRLWAFSATRLRYEQECPPANIHLYYGEHDPYIPNTEWFEDMRLTPTIIPGADHDIYRHLNIRYLKDA